MAVRIKTHTVGYYSTIILFSSPRPAPLNRIIQPSRTTARVANNPDSIIVLRLRQ